MPLILEGFWLLFKLWLGFIIVRENRRQKFSDPQLTALKQYGEAYAHLQAGRTVAALEQLQRDMEHPGKDLSIGHWLQAEAWFAAGWYDHALACTERSLARELFNSHVYYLRARIYFVDGRYRAALSNTESALRLATANPEVYVLQQKCLAALGETAHTATHVAAVPSNT